MCIDGKRRRPGFPSIMVKYRLRAERKKVLDISSVKYYNIDDHEAGMRRFCLIRNTLSRLQHDAREEKLSRHRVSSLLPYNNMEEDSLFNNYGQPAPSPISALSDDDDDELPPSKRPRHFIEEDKENEKANSCEDRLIDVVGDKDESSSKEEAQSYLGENSSKFRLSAISCNSSYLHNSNSLIDLTCSSKLNSSSTYSNNEECTCLPGYINFLKPQHQYPCRFATLVGNDLKSVVYQSLITEL